MAKSVPVVRDITISKFEIPPWEKKKFLTAIGRVISVTVTKPLGLVVTNALTANWWLHLRFPFFSSRLGRIVLLTSSR